MEWSKKALRGEKRGEEEGRRYQQCFFTQSSSHFFTFRNIHHCLLSALLSMSNSVHTAKTCALHSLLSYMTQPGNNTVTATV